MGNEILSAVLLRQRPTRIAYAPNYWQWFAHHRNHGTLPPELADCGSQLELIERLGADVFSRNIYCDEQRGWFGGLAETVWADDLVYEEREHMDGRDRVTERIYRTRAGVLTERLRYVFTESTLVQEKYLIDDYATELDALECVLRARRWRFAPERYRTWQERVGNGGAVIAGELYSPLKMLHMVAGPKDTTFLLQDYPERAAVLLTLHEAAMLDLVQQMVQGGVGAMMSMDNLDTAFHPPHYVERYAASFYAKAAARCHQRGSLFFIHACGQQRRNLKLISSLGVDGLEGVAFPPLGDVPLDEAMELAGERFIITGGISAMEYAELGTREAIFAYVRDLFARIRPYAHRFVFSASCNTPYTAPWEKIVHFRDAWREYAAGE
jgi:uroporphyrinogen-III decarboxylase